MTVGIGWTIGSPEYLSHGVARSICRAQNKFLDTGNFAAPFKERPRDLFEKCAWFKKDDSCSSSPDSGSYIFLLTFFFFFASPDFDLLDFQFSALLSCLGHNIIYIV